MEKLTKLTKREQQVLALLAQGKMNKEIATLHNITTRSVERHVTNILLKLDVTTRTEAAVLFVKATLAVRTDIEDKWQKAA